MPRPLVRTAVVAAAAMAIAGSPACATRNDVRRLAYGVMGPGSSPDPSGESRCVETGGGTIYLQICLHERPGAAVLGLTWDRALERRGAIERCHGEAAAREPDLECTVAFVEAGGGSERTDAVVSPTRTSCDRSMLGCIEAVLGIDASAAEALGPVRATETPSLVLFFSPRPDRDPRESP